MNLTGPASSLSAELFVKSNSVRDDLLVALIDLGTRFPGWPLGKILSYLARTAGYANYDAVWFLTDREALMAAQKLTELNAERHAMQPNQALVSDPSQNEIQVISNQEELDCYLQIELGYCGCARGEEAVELLRDVLRCANERQLSISTPDPMVGCTNAYQHLMARLSFDEVPGLATWFLYLLDSRGFIEHGNNVTECSITAKGSQLLDAIERIWRRSMDDSDAD